MNQSNVSLPPGCVLRKATFGDRWSIRLLVFSAKLDPTQLNWQQFWVIECDGHLVACGQLRNFSGAQELGSLVVASAWRGRGLGTLLTQHLINTSQQPLYLECLGQRLAEFYSRFGFVPISFADLPETPKTKVSSALKDKFRFSQLAKKLLKVPVVFMEYCPNS
ncbi:MULTISPECIES: GNAT family N-acetyltransferase [Nostoc]|uniref:GNAT family N-acetyltransferase n=1 Tax=Nostoc paludosum FACHB-159 TaxID=2692908 RepID=A0ABR8KCG8_9NOSO|nr:MULTISPECIES: GNAT family N-acetyltransferase [Nostoc]MBD2680786.1 GNAT family N-acetyltransferase [Nostoc sp. FACHB-857]MBD2736541.1 GNAT family N-acetyltransferase [Nostoc paludosum FACHB-159]